MKINNIIFVFTILLCNYMPVKGQYQRSEVDILMDIRNRITVNHDDGSKAVFILTDHAAKTNKDKYYYWYQSRTIQQTQGGYSGKLLHGIYSLYYPNKQLAKQGFYRKGLPNGDWKFWQENNHLSKEEHWKKGRLTGNVNHFDADGHLVKTGKMRDGEWHGKVLVKTDADSSLQPVYFQQGKTISEEDYYKSNLYRRSGRFINQLWNKLFFKSKFGEKNNAENTDVENDTKPIEP